MTGNEIDPSDVPTRTFDQRRRQKLLQAYKDGGMDVLEQFVPGILEAMERGQQLLPKLFDLVEEALERKDTAALKDAGPMLKMLLDENKRLLDRRFGSSVQRTQNEHNVKVQHVSLRDLMNQRRLARPVADDPTDEIIVEAEVVE